MSQPETTLCGIANDQFRNRMFNPEHGKERVLITQGISSLDDETKAKVLLAVKNYKDFDNDEDPDHEFGCIELPDIPKVFWKIDLFENAEMEWAAEDPTNCYRLLTVLLAEEW